MDGVLGGVRLRSGERVVGRLRLLRQVGGRVVTHHPVLLVRTLRVLLALLLVSMRVGSARVVRVYLRRRLERGAGLEVRRLQPVKRGRTQLADQVVEGKVCGQVLGARRRRRRRGERRRRRRRGQRQRLPADTPQALSCNDNVYIYPQLET